MDKRITKSNVISVPATLVASTEYFSPVYNTKALHKGEAFVYVGDSSKIGSGGLKITTYGSADGTTFYAQGTSTIAVSTGAKTAVVLAPFSPYFKVGVVSSGTGQATGHGVKVDVVLVEKNPEHKRAYGQVLVDATTPASDIVSITCPGTGSKFEKVFLTATINSGATITDFDYTVETSADGSVWYTIDTASNLTAVPAAKAYEDVGLLKYVRVVPSSFTTSGSAVVGMFLYGIGY